MAQTKRLIINADDYGLAPGCNRAIEELFSVGAITSASCMANKLTSMSGYLTGRSGVHLETIPAGTPPAVRRSWLSQVERFCHISSSPPTHFDTHHHVHGKEDLFPVYLELCAFYGVACVPLIPAHRHDARRAGVRCCDHANIQWVDGQRSTLENLLKIDFSWAKTVHLMTHPGYVDDDLRRYSTMTLVRERELEILRDPTFEVWLRSEGIERISYEQL